MRWGYHPEEAPIRPDDGQAALLVLYSLHRGRFLIAVRVNEWGTRVHHWDYGAHRGKTGQILNPNDAVLPPIMRDGDLGSAFKTRSCRRLHR